MRMLLLIAVVLSAGILLIKPIEATAHGKDSGGGHTDAQMKKLHAMMQMFSMASAELESALEKGDVTLAKFQADKILAAVPDLKKSKPHKNVNQRKKYVELATHLEQAVNTAVNLAQKDDFTEAQAAFKKIEEVCAACHTKFTN